MQHNKKHSILGLIPLFEVMTEMGVDPEEILKNRGLELSSLSGSALISQDLELDIVQDAIALVDDPLFGIKAGSQSTFTSYGTFALLVMSAPSFKEACYVSVKFQELSLLFSHLTLHVEKDYVELRYTLPKVTPKLLHFIADRDFAGNINFIKELMDDTDSIPVSAGIARPKPDEELLAVYRNMSTVKLHFDQDYNWFRLPNRYLGTKLKHGNALAHKLYRVQAQEVLRKFYPKDEDLATQVRQIMEGYDHRYPPAKEIAGVLETSERSLRRKLDAQGLSYRHILDEHRKSKAIYLLKNGNLAISQLAETLGYSEPASFLRAFKRWTGKTPKRYLNSTSN